MGFDDLKLFKIIIILSPNSDRIIIATTHQSAVINPLDTLNIIGMSFQNILALVLISRGIELPNPNIFVTTAWCDLLVCLMPINAFYLNLNKWYLIFMSLQFSQELICRFVENVNWDQWVKWTHCHLVALVRKLHTSNCLQMLSDDRLLWNEIKCTVLIHYFWPFYFHKLMVLSSPTAASKLSFGCLIHIFMYQSTDQRRLLLLLFKVVSSSIIISILC